MPMHSNIYEAPKILGVLDEDGNRVILTDPAEIGNFILSGGAVCHRFSSKDGASIWQELGHVLNCDDDKLNVPTIYFGVTSDDIRMIVRDLDVVEHHVKRGAKLHYSFPTMGRASFWEKHGIVRDHFFEAYSVDQNTVGLHEVLTEGAERTAQAFKTQEKSKYASLSRPKADSNGPTVYFGLTHWEDRANNKAFFTDLDEVEAHVNRGAILHYSFPTAEIAVKWVTGETGTFLDDNVVEYSAIPYTDLHEFLMDGVTRTARIAASLPIPEPDLNVHTFYFGLKLLSGSRFILTDPNEVSSYFMEGAEIPFLFQTEEAADYWKDHGTLRKDDIVHKFPVASLVKLCGLHVEDQGGDIPTCFFGVTHWENFRMILSDHTEIRAYLEHGGSIDGVFANSDAASYWLNNGVMKDSWDESCTVWNPTTITEFFRHVLKNACNSLSETDFHASTIYFGVTTDDIRMIVRDLHEVEHHVQRGAKLHYSFPTMRRASFWEEHGIVRDHFFEAYSVDQNTVGLHEVLTEGAERTAQAFKTQEKSKYASLSRPKADSNGLTVYFGLTHWEDRTYKLLLTDFHEIQAYVNSGATVQYSFPTFERASEWQKWGTFLDDNVVEYSAIQTTVDLHEFLMDGVEKTARIAASLPIPEPDLNVHTVYFGLKLLSGSRFILTDPNEVASFFMKGTEIPFLFQTEEAADYWKDHGTLREDDIVHEFDHTSLVELYENVACRRWWLPDFSLGVTHWENFRMILSDPTEIRAYLEHGASIDGVFANSDAASYWLEHGVMKDKKGIGTVGVECHMVPEMFATAQKKAPKMFRKLKNKKKRREKTKEAAKLAAGLAMRAAIAALL